MSQYATAEEFAQFGLPADAYADVSPTVIAALLQAASAIVNGMLEARGYPGQLDTWDKDLSSAVCKLAAYDLIFHHRGANPTDPGHAAIVLSRDWAERHIEKVASGKIKFTNTTPARAPTMVAQVISGPRSDGEDGTRGW